MYLKMINMSDYKYMGEREINYQTCAEQRTPIFPVLPGM